MIKKSFYRIKIEGDRLIASFLLDKNLLNKTNKFLHRLILLLKKHKLELIGIYKNNKKLSNKIGKLTYKNLLIQDNKVFGIYFKGEIGVIKTLSCLNFYNAGDNYVDLEFIAPHFDLIEKHNAKIKEKNLLEFQKIAEGIYTFIQPLYGLIGQEEFVSSLEDIVQRKKLLPNFWGFYSKKLIDIIGINKFLKILRGSYLIKNLPDGGVFFAITDWDSSNSEDISSKKRKRLLLKLIKSRKMTKFIEKELNGKNEK